MDEQFPPAASSSRNCPRPHKGGPSGDPTLKRPRTDDHALVGYAPSSNMSAQEQNPPPTRIHEGVMKIDGRDLKVKLVFILHTEDTFREEVCDQSQAVLPMHRTFPRDSVPFKHLRNLGRGRSSVVSESMATGGQFYLPGKVYAHKTVTLETRQWVRFAANELALLDKARSLHHPHLQRVVMTYEEEISSHALKYGIVMHPVAKYTLSLFYESLDSAEDSRHTLVDSIEKWVGCLGSALSYVHAHGLLHRNIKASGILLHKEQVFFTEFAVSNYHRDTGMLVETEHTSEPTVIDIYTAPEVCMQQPFGPKADIFSLGYIYLEMLAMAAGIPYKSFALLFKEEGLLSHTQRLATFQSLLAEISTPGRLPSKSLQDLIKCCQSMVSLEPDVRPSAFRVTEGIYNSILRHKPPSSDDKGRPAVPCECWEPWMGNQEEGCQMLL